MTSKYWSKFESEGEFNLETAIGQWHSTKIDPYLVWAFATNFAHLSFPEDSNSVPIILELNPSSEFGNAASFASASSGLGFVDIPEIYHDDSSLYNDIKFLTAVVDLGQFLTALNSGNEVLASIYRFQIGLPVKTHQAPVSAMAMRSIKMGDSAATMSYQKDNVETVRKPVVGIIDDGIGFLNKQFCDSNDLSRIRYFWNQNEKPDSLDSVLSSSITSSVEYFAYGYELNHTEIDAISNQLAAGNQASNEASWYRSINYDSVSRHASHGTHVLDCAAGLGDEANSDMWNDTAIIGTNVRWYSLHSGTCESTAR